MLNTSFMLGGRALHCHHSMSGFGFHESEADAN